MDFKQVRMSDHVLSECIYRCSCKHENWANGTLLEVEVCSPQLFFHSLPWEVRRWDDKLLTTLPTPHPSLPPGRSTDGRKASHRLTSPCFWTWLSLPAALLPALHVAFKFSAPPYRSHLFPVRVAAFFEVCLFTTLEVWSIQGMWKSAPQESSMRYARWYLLGSLTFRWKKQGTWLVVLEVGQFLHNSSVKLQCYSERVDSVSRLELKH